MRIRHDSRSHKTLNEQDIHQTIQTANSEFERTLNNDHTTATSFFHGVTCTIDFHTLTDDVNQNGRAMLGVVADKLGYHLSHVPYVTSDIWLPSSDFYNAKQLLEHGRCAGEFLFDQPLAEKEVTRKIQAVVRSNRSLRAPGIHGTIPGMDNVHDVHFVGRSF